MAESISSVGAGKDYTDGVAWEAGEQGAIASGNQTVGEWYGVPAEAASISILGWTFADATSRVIMRPATGEKHTGTPGSGAGINNTVAGATPAITTPNSQTDSNVTVSGLELYHSGGSSDPVVSIFVAAADNYNWVVEDCIIHGISGSFSGGVQVTGSGGASLSVTVNNCVFYGDGTNGVAFYAVAAGEDHKMKVSYCTAYEMNYGFIQGIFTNCMAFKSNTNDFFGSEPTSDYNVSSDATAPGTNNLQSKTAYASYFTDPTTTKDFSLLDTTDDGGIFGVTGLAGTPIAGITTDILGGTRDETSPDLGAFEFGATPPGPGGGGGGPLGSKFSKFLN